jgi:CNP1-like family protein
VARVALLLMCCMLLPVVSSAQPRPDPEEEGTKTWAELNVKLPPFPKAQNLISFDVSGASSNRFYIDTESISIGGDGVARYTLVIKGPGGGENISYEGMRCETREQKYYAFGRRDGSWSNARSSEWRRIEYKDINRQHGVLYLDYFCPDKKRPVKSAVEAVNLFKYGVPPRSGM